MELNFSFPEPGSKILLINTHAYDVRLPWSQWHQPTGLLQLGSWLKKRGCDVKLIDCLNWYGKEKLRRRKLYSVTIANYEIDVWCYGALWGHLTEYVYQLKNEKWTPDQVYVSCFQTHWWEAARDVIARIKQKWFPTAEVILGGVYPCLEPDHAKKYTEADIVVNYSIAEARTEVPDFSLYSTKQKPIFAGIYFYQPQNVIDVEQALQPVGRSPQEIADEVKIKSKLGVREFAFFDEVIRIDEKLHYKDVLREIARLDLDVRFIGLGNISPEFVDGETARLMHKAGYRQLYLRCDVTSRADGISYTNTYESYQTCVDALHREAGFKPRTGQVTAMLQVGHPYSDIEAVAERLIRLSSIVGVVNLVQYQYTRRMQTGSLYASILTSAEENENILNVLNCKYYSLARATGVPYEDYVELTRLAALLSSKYRSKTFDFLGNNLISEIIRTSIRTESWKPRVGSSASQPFDVIPLIPIERNEVD